MLGLRRADVLGRATPERMGRSGPVNERRAAPRRAPPCRRYMRVAMVVKQDRVLLPFSGVIVLPQDGWPFTRKVKRKAVRPWSK